MLVPSDSPPGLTHTTASISADPIWDGSLVGRMPKPAFRTLHQSVHAVRIFCWPDRLCSTRAVAFVQPSACRSAKSAWSRERVDRAKKAKISDTHCDVMGFIVVRVALCDRVGRCGTESIVVCNISRKAAEEWGTSGRRIDLHIGSKGNGSMHFVVWNDILEQKAEQRE